MCERRNIALERLHSGNALRRLRAAQQIPRTAAPRSPAAAAYEKLAGWAATPLRSLFEVVEPLARLGVDHNRMAQRRVQAAGQLQNRERRGRGAACSRRQPPALRPLVLAHHGCCGGPAGGVAAAA